MKKRLIISLLIATCIFLLFFFFRLVYGYFSYPDSGTAGQVFNEAVQQAEYSSKVRNYATEKYSDQSTAVYDQKYEKIADLSSQTADFSKDETHLRKTIESYKALIQDEKKSGLVGRRSLTLMIGVPPENFDPMINTLSEIGRLKSIDIIKRDKTNEYRELNAKQKTLVKARDSLLALKERNANVEELINLESRILEIESEIQSLGVSLGEFDQENEFCTVNMTLSEIKGASRIPLLQRIKIALEWTIKWYILLAAALFFCVFGLFILIGIIDRLKLWDKLAIK